MNSLKEIIIYWYNWLTAFKNCLTSPEIVFLLIFFENDHTMSSNQLFYTTNLGLH